MSSEKKIETLKDFADFLKNEINSYNYIYQELRKSEKNALSNAALYAKSKINILDHVNETLLNSDFCKKNPDFLMPEIKKEN